MIREINNASRDCDKEGFAVLRYFCPKGACTIKDTDGELWFDLSIIIRDGLKYSAKHVGDTIAKFIKSNIGNKKVTKCGFSAQRCCLSVFME